MRSAGRRTSGELARLGLLIALAGAAQVLEAVLPSPLPWFRLGLGNALVLVALHLGGLGAACWVALGKVFVGSLLTGRFLSPGFVLSLGATLGATGAMGVAARGAPPLGFVGVSVVGGQVHALVQLALAAWLLDTPAVWALAPLLGALAVGAAVITGLLAHALASALAADQGALGDPR
ncbi:MAG: hypothetical protein Kow0092_13780 [Deferrisomatales bacterium]